MILDNESSDFFVPAEGYGETTEDTSKEKKNRKHGLLNWFKQRVWIIKSWISICILDFISMPCVIIF